MARIIDTLYEMKFSQEEEKRIEEIFNQINLERLAKQRGVLNGLRHPEEDFNN